MQYHANFGALVQLTDIANATLRQTGGYYAKRIQT